MTLAILSIIIIGLIFIVLEFFVFPGTSFAGIFGIIFLVLGNYLAFQNFGPFYGAVTLVGSIVAGSILLTTGLRSLKNSQYTLKEQVKGRVNELTDLKEKVGDVGMSVSDLKPFGKAVFEGKKIEVKSINDFIDRDTKIQIVEISLNTVLVTKFSA